MLRTITFVSYEIRIRSLVSLALLGVGALSLLSQAPPSADTFVSSATPNINYGSGVTLAVGPETTTYVQFKLAGIPANATITKATLRLYVDAVVKAGSFDVYEVNNAWTESKLTYNTPAPVPGISATGGKPIAVTTASVNQFVPFVISSTNEPALLTSAGALHPQPSIAGDVAVLVTDCQGQPVNDANVSFSPAEHPILPWGQLGQPLGGPNFWSVGITDAATTVTVLEPGSSRRSKRRFPGTRDRHRMWRSRLS